MDAHIEEVFALEENRPRVGVKFDPDTGEHVLYVNRLPNLAEFYGRVGLLFSDAINNLRISLDYLVYQLALWHTGGAVVYDDRITFPISDNDKAWPGIEGKELREVSPTHRAMLKGFQPFERRHYQPLHPSEANVFHPLALLRDLTKVDKHRLLTAIMIPAKGMYFAAPKGSPGTVPEPILGAIMQRASLSQGSINLLLVPIELGAPLSRARLPEGFPREVEVAG